MFVAAQCDTCGDIETGTGLSVGLTEEEAYGETSSQMGNERVAGGGGSLRARGCIYKSAVLSTD